MCVEKYIVVCIINQSILGRFLTTTTKFKFTVQLFIFVLRWCHRRCRMDAHQSNERTTNIFHSPLATLRSTSLFCFVALHQSSIIIIIIFLPPRLLLVYYRRCCLLSVCCCLCLYYFPT